MLYRAALYTYGGLVMVIYIDYKNGLFGVLHECPNFRTATIWKNSLFLFYMLSHKINPKFYYTR